MKRVLLALLLVACGSANNTVGDADPTSADAPPNTEFDAGGAGSATCSERGMMLPTRNGNVVVVDAAGPGMVTVGGEMMTLRQVISDAQPQDTILLGAGVYTFSEAAEGDYTGLYFTTPDITLRSSSGNAGAVILDSAYADHGAETGVITIAASRVVVADLTVRRSIFHLIHLVSGSDEAIIHNVALEDGGQQFLKASPGSGNVDAVEVSCSRFLMSASGRDNVWGYGSQDGNTRCYTGGIDTHSATNWHIHDSRFEGIYCDATGVQRPAHGKKASVRNGMTYQGGLAEQAIHMWDSEQGSAHTIERNRIKNCARGIGIGLSDDVYGGVIRNNMIFSEHAESQEHDVGIGVARGHDMLIANNTVYYSHANGYPNAIEYRWPETSGLRVFNNLSNREVSARNNASASLENNVVNANASWFVNANNGDLHLSECNESTIVGEGTELTEVADDFDAEPRNASNDIGADQCTP